MATTSASQQEKNGIVSQMDDTCFFFKIYHAVVSLRFDFRIVEMWAMPHGEFDPVEIRIAVTVGGDSKSSARMGFTAPRRGNESWIDWMESLDRSITKRISTMDYVLCFCLYFCTTISVRFENQEISGCGVYPHGSTWPSI